MTRTSFGTTPQGATVERFTIRGDNGIIAKVSSYGATLVELHAPDREGRSTDVVLGFDSVDGYLTDTNPYFGATVGRVANRIAGAAFTLGDQDFRLAANEGPHHLHGGVERSFDKVLWELVSVDDTHVELRYVSAAGEEGYPGRVEASTRYELEGDTLTIEYRATTDATTPLNMTNHSYFNLSGAGSGSILQHELQLAADVSSAVDDELLPTGENLPVEGTPLDFRSPRVIGERIGELLSVPGALGYDHNFVLRGEVDGLRAAAVLHDPASGRVLELTTNQPCLQFYSGNRIDETIDGKNGERYERHGALCLEPQQFPDAVHHPEFPSILIEPGQTYRNVSRYRLTTA